MNKEEIRGYCLNCKIKPCSKKGCPLENDIPAFIHEENLEKAYQILCNTTVLPAICGRICPHYKQCQGSCIRGIKSNPVEIGKMETIIGDNSIKENLQIPKDIDNDLINKNVAIIGGGPAGLTCAAFLAKKGINVTIYEKHSYLGGILVHGIPEFRLDKNIVKNTIDKIINLGIKVELNKQLGKDIFINELKNNYDAVFIGIGANIPSIMKIEGIKLEGVYGGNDLLEYNKHPNYRDKIVAINGGGNVAMDSARIIKKLGAQKVYVIYRRAREQMPAEEKEIEAAMSEEIEFLFQNNIVKIIGEKKVEKLELIKTELIQKEGDNRLCPINIKGSNYEINVDYLVMATGSKVEESIITEFDKNEQGYIKINENMQTSIENVFAGGDIVGTKATVAWASRSGRNAAYSIINYLKNKK